jgi:hypothetical protein
VRASILSLLHGLGVRLGPIKDQAVDWSRVGVGCSDHPAIASRLPSRWTYTNTHLDRFPFLDIADVPPELSGLFEFVICSDVLEHVVPPHHRAFDGLAELVRPDGFAVVTVPVFDGEASLEYYPGLRAFHVDAGPVLRWSDKEGIEQIDEAPEMHGGQGLVVAFRRFAANDVVRSLRASGFAQVEAGPFSPELGVWPIDDAGVFLARREVIEQPQEDH